MFLSLKLDIRRLNPLMHEISFSFLVGYPKWKVRCSTTAVSLSKDAKVEIDQ